MIKGALTLFILLIMYGQIQAQVNWLSFEQLDSALTSQPKPVLIEFYTEWCTYCKKMDQEVFTDKDVINDLNASFYAVRFDAETQRTVAFDGFEFIREQNANFHQLAMSLASQNSQFTPPALIFFDKEFNVTERIFSYQSRKRLLAKLKKHR